MVTAAAVDPEEVKALLAAARFSPDSDQLAAIVDAYGHLRLMLDRLDADYGFDDEPAHVFSPLKF